MNNMSVLFRSFFRKGKNNLIKILSLGVGLAVGLILVSKIYFEQSFDDFIPDSNRIYQIQSNVVREDNAPSPFGQVSGAIALGMKDNIPEIEMATRYTWMAWKETFYTEEKTKHKATFIFADTCFFKVFHWSVLIGDVDDTMNRPMHIMISREVAESMGGISTVVGKSIELNSNPGKTLIVGGVFENVPENSHFEFDAVVSMSSLSQFSYDGTENWLGNDRYMGYVKLYSGVEPGSLAPAVRKMQKKFQPLEEMKKSGVDIFYTFYPLHKLHNGNPEVKRSIRMLSIIAFAILFTAVMNYILIVISSLISRSKEIAVNKCYGASGKNIYHKMLSETFIHLTISVVLAFLLIMAFRGIITDILGTSLQALFSPGSCFVILLVCLIVFFVSGLLPGYLYARIPVSFAFRNYNETRRFWKLGLLFIQFVIAGFLISLVAIIGKQYKHMLNDDPGYTYQNTSFVILSGIEQDDRRRLMDEIDRLPEVAEVSSCYQLPYNGASGNNISLPEGERELFNTADNYGVGNGYLQLMEIPIVEGRSFSEDVSSSHEVMVSRSFVEKMKNYTDWNDGAVGKSILISEHSFCDETYTICGVYENYRIGSIISEDTRPSIMFYENAVSRFLVIKYHEQTTEANMKVSQLLQTILPGKDLQVYSYATEIENQYINSRRFRDSTLIGGLVALLISLIGLIGYTNDEMNRRKKETAIRKVNGATILDIQRLFLKDIIRFALPAVVLAGGVAAYIGSKWLEQYSEKFSLTPVLFLLCGLLVLFIILTTVSINCYKAAVENPAISVNNE